jgi:Nuclease-related domain
VSPTDRRAGPKPGLPPALKRWFQERPSEYAWEQDGLDHIRNLVPKAEPYRTWATFSFTAASGRINECDLFIAVPGGLYLVELKGHPDHLVNNGETWSFREPSSGRVRTLRNPLHLVDLKSKELKSRLDGRPTSWASASASRGSSRRSSCRLRICARRWTRSSRSGYTAGMRSTPGCRGSGETCWPSHRTGRPSGSPRNSPGNCRDSCRRSASERRRRICGSAMTGYFSNNRWTSARPGGPARRAHRHRARGRPGPDLPHRPTGHRGGQELGHPSSPARIPGAPGCHPSRDHTGDADQGTPGRPGDPVPAQAFRPAAGRLSRGPR